MIRSGHMPRSENGKSSCWTMLPQTPFCPCLLLNLSPSSGLRVWRIINLMHKLLFLSEDRATLSTTPVSPSAHLKDCILRLKDLSASPIGDTIGPLVTTGDSLLM
nr:hypothetical protein A4E30_00093 [Ipomoea batatas]